MGSDISARRQLHPIDRDLAQLLHAAEEIQRLIETCDALKLPLAGNHLSMAVEILHEHARTKMTPTSTH